MINYLVVLTYPICRVFAGSDRAARQSHRRRGLAYSRSSPAKENISRSCRIDKSYILALNCINGRIRRGNASALKVVTNVILTRIPPCDKSCIRGNAPGKIVYPFISVIPAEKLVILSGRRCKGIFFVVGYIKRATLNASARRVISNSIFLCSPGRGYYLVFGYRRAEIVIPAKKIVSVTGCHGLGRKAVLLNRLYLKALSSRNVKNNVVGRLSSYLEGIDLSFAAYVGYQSIVYIVADSQGRSFAFNNAPSARIC